MTTLLLTWLAVSGMNYGAMDLSTGQVLGTGASSPMTVNVAPGDTCGLYACDEAGTSPMVEFGWFPCPRLVAMPRVSGSLCAIVEGPVGTYGVQTGQPGDWQTIGTIETTTGVFEASVPQSGHAGFLRVEEEP